MPARINEEVRQAIELAIAANPDKSAAQIHRGLKDLEGQGIISKAPSPRTVSTVLADVRDSGGTPWMQRPYRWPDSHLDGPLPFEAGAVCMHVIELGIWHDAYWLVTDTGVQQLGRPSNALCLWYWRLTQAMLRPDNVDPEETLKLAQQLVEGSYDAGEIEEFLTQRGSTISERLQP